MYRVYDSARIEDNEQLISLARLRGDMVNRCAAAAAAAVETAVPVCRSNNGIREMAASP